MDHQISFDLPFLSVLDKVIMAQHRLITGLFKTCYFALWKGLAFLVPSLAHILFSLG